ncbi:mannose-1-phosphate guanylyltransferase [Rhodohalobacter sp. SW132]|uniref:mannose-1-phosphate guanylyltransferase n=1 Tax=Rhodohalobacter sp. SW132 TaxID=2293433 RepID=UPI000E23CA57|nr:sugar phosphate nucleotidyltransferase [Rhodohalobacter sp. SW132]REL38338.1 mannose-1-phosphate guanylyltransferase [Rhodohalobacter sp. SW132]
MNRVNILLTGGVGSRLWPLSKKSRPKQYVPIFGDRTLFQLSALRNVPLTDRLVVVCNEGNSKLSRENLSDAELSADEYVIESEARNTAAAVAFGAFACANDDLMLVTPADHIIDDLAAYERAVNRAFELASEGALVTFGLKPTRPETGYGYIEYEGETVLSFKEKPNVVTAKNYLLEGRFLWNSGIFCMKAGVYLNELKKHRPDIYHAAEKAFSRRSGSVLPSEESALIPSESIDYAVMEKSENIRVVPSDFGWSDLGSYESLYDYFSSDDTSSVVQGTNLVFSNKHVEIIGLEDMVVVEKDDAILILPKNQSQSVKAVFQRLEKEKPELLE